MRPNRKVRKNIRASRQSIMAPERMKFIWLLLVPLLFLAAAGYFAALSLRSAFSLQRIVFTGNEHLGDEELKTLSGLKPGDNVLTLSGAGVYSKMMGSAWLRSVSVRKELPDGIHILMKEAEPFALLDLKGRLFLLDEKGKMLEELKDSKVPFLPVISGDPFSDREAFAESMTLVRAIKKTGFLSRRDHIEIIARKRDELAMNADGTVIKIGSGEYEEKLGRLTELEEEIKRRHIPVDYVDLRFASKVIVKPVNEVIR